MPRRALILCSIVVVGCSSATAVSGSDPTVAPTAVGSTSTTVAATSTSVRPTSSSSTSTTSTSPSTSSSTSTSSTSTLPSLRAEPTAAEQVVLDQFTSRAFTLMASEVHALGIAIARHDSVIGTVAYGRRPDGQSLEPDAPFRIASISKVLTSVVVLQLVEDGTLHLDDTLGELGMVPPGAPDPLVGGVTVRQLLQHTSGIGKMRTVFFGTEAAADWHAAAEVALRTPLAALPGTVYAYSNANYVILGALVEHITGDTFATVVDERVIRPLSIRHASLAAATGALDPLGPAYVVNPDRRYVEALGPAGAWVLPADGLARLVAALQPDSASPLLTPAMLTEMRTPTTLVDDERDWSYGLGLMVFSWAHGHTGTIEDVRTLALALPNGYSVVVLSAGTRVPSGEDLMGAFGAELMTLAALPSP
jgi:D-alanyl-D-alanine carboxypeptidase